MPLVEDFRVIERFPIGNNHRTMMCDCIKGPGCIEYEYLLVVHNMQTEKPVLFVASERNSSSYGDSHFLGVFNDNGHSNLGSSDSWGDLKTFKAKALEILKEEFGAV